MNKVEMKKQIEILQSNKLNSIQSLALFSGFSYQIILDKNLFTHNKDLEGFINAVYLDPHRINHYRPYLYSSRTLLGARLSKLIILNFSPDDIALALLKIINIFEDVFGSTWLSQKRTRKIDESYIDASLSAWIKETRLRSKNDE
ncbi:hypothetical protein UCCLBBS449_1672 [Levilactobacillus brevis]|uniref:Uncharacterized protein n=1 Tax=Levilactobacillus brevis TaxID=1580 RepID=A0A5B7Y0K2_LEVBR|nr:hypothetical protein [Levilactobacillus brevis]QCZ53535.1 hypothetical protein UCCLBBS449_1600 [Levilactobacillus brevis]QCZ53607.1 hypothetical protein UCCLBBS449_1672 [Levilactobacillus brevis]